MCPAAPFQYAYVIVCSGTVFAILDVRRKMWREMVSDFLQKAPLG